MWEGFSVFPISGIEVSTESKRLLHLLGHWSPIVPGLAKRYCSPSKLSNVTWCGNSELTTAFPLLDPHSNGHLSCHKLFGGDEYFWAAARFTFWKVGKSAQVQKCAASWKVGKSGTNATSSVKNLWKSWRAGPGHKPCHMSFIYKANMYLISFIKLFGGLTNLCSRFYKVFWTGTVPSLLKWRGGLSW